MENKNDEKETYTSSPGKNTFLTSLPHSTSLSFSRLLSSPVLLSWKDTLGPFRGARDAVWVVIIRIQQFLSNDIFLSHDFSPHWCEFSMICWAYLVLLFCSWCSFFCLLLIWFTSSVCVACSALSSVSCRLLGLSYVFQFGIGSKTPHLAQGSSWSLPREATLSDPLLSKGNLGVKRYFWFLN